MQRPESPIVTLEDILITEELSKRSPHHPSDFLAENQAMRTLVQQMARGSETVMQTLVELALSLCKAGTAGVSLLEITPNGEEIFRWNVLSGRLAQYAGGTIPRHFSPCGICLERGTPQLFAHPERYFTNFQVANTLLVEGLVLPLIAEGQALGTIWLLSHEQERHFDLEDVRVMTGLADFTATALLLNQRKNQELLAANVRLETEIAERKHSEAILRESEELLRGMIENLPGAAVFVVDRNLRYLLAEGKALAVAGFKPEALVGATIFEVLPPELVSHYERMYRKALAGEPFEDEHNLNDRSYISRGTPLRSPDGEVYAVVAVSYDITERKQAEKLLRASEVKYRSLFESINEGFALCELIYDATGKAIDWRFLEVNPAFERLTSFENAVGKTAVELNQIPGSAWLETFSQVAQTGEATRFEIYIEDVDYWFDLQVSRMDGDTRHLVVVFNNITERKRAEQTLAADLQDTKLLHDLSARLVTEDDIQALYQEIMAAAIALTRADAGTVQILDQATQELVLLATQGFERDLTEHFHRVNASSNTSCGKALFTGDRAFIDFDVPESEDPDGAMRIHVEAGYLSAQSTPLIARSGKVIGMVSTHWRNHHRPSDRELRFLDLLARQAADLIEQRQAEAVLRESEVKYRSLFTSIDEGYALCELMYDENKKPVDLRYLQVNPAFEQLTGLENVVGKTAVELNLNFESLWLETIAQVLQTGVATRFEDYAESLNRWFDVYLSRVGDEGSRQIAVVFNDITVRKQTEEQLRRAAEMDAFRVMLSDALRPLSDAVEIQATVTRITMNFFEADRCYYCEIIDGSSIIRQDAAQADLPSVVGAYPLENSPIFRTMLDAGQTFVIQDVHTTNVLDGNLRQTCLQLQILAGLMVPVIKQGEPVGILVITQTTPRNWTEFEMDLAEEIADRTWATIERTRVEAHLREAELQRVREQSALEQERQRAETLAELDRAKTLFFSNVSHEFRTPLTLLLAPLQEVLSDRALSPAHRESLELVHRNSLRLLKLVNTLLDFSRIEAGRMEAVYEPTDLSTLTTELASVFRSAIERAGLRLIVDCSPLPEPVYVDREMWEKIVLNLISNAFKFTFEGEIKVKLHSTDARAILQIQDTGTGIAPEHLPHLFERFYQVRGEQARTHEGSGIGLALVHELIQMQGGTIDVSSTVGQGTCFMIALPFGTDHLPNDRLQSVVGDHSTATRTLTSTTLSAASYVEETERWLPDEDTETISNLTQSSSSSAQILLVDDNADMRDYLVRVLGEHVQVEAVTDGASALAKIQTKVPDLVLSDVMMPGLDGFQLLQALRADPRTKEIPIILLSARAGEEAIVEGLNAGADDYLIKPFSATELKSRVNAHLQMAQLRSEALEQERMINRRKDELLSTVSHELNTPLVAILGWTRLLRANSSSPVMLMKALDTIERNATLQAKLIQDLLDLSRITAGKLRLNLQPVELESVIETAIATVAQTAQDKGINLLSLDTTSVIIMGDHDRLLQVFCNLLTNAIKFTPESGNVTVKLSVIDDYAEICVSDTGIGIVADFLPHIFERFRQAEDLNNTKGLGLGLTIAKHLVELHNGTIDAESAGENQGATFIVKLPLFYGG